MDWKWVIYFSSCLVFTPSTASYGQQMQSVLVTPSVQLHAQTMETPVQQAQPQAQIQTQAPPPQIIYVQQQQPRISYADAYFRYQMWFKAHYRPTLGIFRPRYIRRCPGDPAYDMYHIMRMTGQW